MLPHPGQSARGARAARVRATGVEHAEQPPVQAAHTVDDVNFIHAMPLF